MATRRFPDEFLFGCATSAYQIEGGIENDWAAWERAGRLKDPTIRSGLTADHWNRFESDFELLKSLGARAYRFSVEWARIEPEPGRFDQAAIDRYGQMLAALQRAGIEPIVTLLHFTHPPWFHAQSPWHDPSGEPARRFAAMVRRIAPVLVECARIFTVLNEPMVWTTGAYLAGLIPPGEKSLPKTAHAAANLVRAHAAAAQILKGLRPDAQIGVANNVVCFEPARPGHPVDRWAARYVDHHFNHLFPRALTTGRVQLGFVPGVRKVFEIPEAKGSLDFIGVNYYSRAFLRARLSPLAGWPRVEAFYEDRGGGGVTDLGWEIHPEGLGTALDAMARYDLPLMITENGLDDRDDSRRSAFLYDHLAVVHEAIARGVDVRGYFFWSLLDNFEWLEGFLPRFGLYKVDYETQARAPTSAAALFKEVAESRMLPEVRPPCVVRPGKGPVPVG